MYFYNARYYDPTLGRFIQADTIVPSPANPQSLNRYAYVLNNPLRYTDPSGHFEEDQIRQSLIDQGYTEEEVDDMIHRWSTEAQHKDWWAMLRAALPGDCLVGANKRIGQRWDRLWHGMFLDNPDGKLLFKYLGNGVQNDIAAFYSDDPKTSSAHTRVDIILGRKGSADGGYRFQMGTDLFSDGIPNIESMQPRFEEVWAGAARMLTGGTLMLKGGLLVAAGTAAPPAIFVGVGVFVLGVGATKAGTDQMVGYFDAINVTHYVENRLRYISPWP